MRRFKSIVQAQRFLGVHSAVYNLFNLDGIWFLLVTIAYFDGAHLNPGRVQWFKWQYLGEHSRLEGLTRQCQILSSLGGDGS